MGRKYFGTDGVRGRVGQAPITPDFIMRLGYAAGSALVARDGMPANEHPAVLIGKDTRISGYMLEAALDADAGGRLPYSRPAPAGRGGDLRLAQSL
jgi:phosphoglucosamine mutase